MQKCVCLPAPHFTMATWSSRTDWESAEKPTVRSLGTRFFQMPHTPIKPSSRLPAVHHIFDGLAALEVPRAAWEAVGLLPVEDVDAGHPRFLVQRQVVLLLLRLVLPLLVAEPHLSPKTLPKHLAHEEHHCE